MNEAEARARAIDAGGMTFSVCPVCDDRFAQDVPLGELEAQLQAHCEGHSYVEYLSLISRLRTELALARAPYLPVPDRLTVSYDRLATSEGASTI